MIAGEFGSSVVAIVTNPNADTWGAQGLPGAVLVFDEDGAEIERTSTFATLLPGQTNAVLAFLTTTAQPDRVEVTFEGADFNWLPTEVPPDTLKVSGVKTENGPVFGIQARARSATTATRSATVFSWWPSTATRTATSSAPISRCSTRFRPVSR